MVTSKTRLVWSPGSEKAHQSALIERSSAGNRPMLEAFTEWMEQERCLSPESITVWLGPACTFVEAVTMNTGASCAGAFQSLTPDGIESFFVRYGEHSGMGARRSMRSAMRSVLEFATCRDWVGRELADAVPSLRSYRLSGLPKGVSDEQVSMLLGTPWAEGECPGRDRAIVVLLASYGVRRGQISALRLADIDWDQRTVDFAAHKGGKRIQHDMTDCVGESLADYLRNERPASDSDYVFLRARSPHVRLGPGAISMMVKSRMVRCGLAPRGPHTFRHAFATRLLRAGQPVKAIADLLGHRSLDAVAVYAKVDHARLLEVAAEWPEAVS